MRQRANSRAGHGGGLLDMDAHTQAPTGYELVTYAYADEYGYAMALVVDSARWTVRPCDADACEGLLAWRDMTLAWLTVPGARMGVYGPEHWPCVQHPDGRLAILAVADA